MNTEALKTFVVLSECGNFTKTAQTLFCSQSTVSDRIRELENQLGQKLLTRGTRSATLTSAGNAFLVYAQKILDTERQAITEMHMIQKYEGVLHVAATHNLFDHWIVNICQQFCDLFSNVALKIEIAHSEEILPRLSDYDIAFTYTPVQSSSYECEPFIAENLILVTNAENTEYQDGIFFEQLEKLPLINAQLSDSNSIWPFPYDRLSCISINIFSKVPLFLTSIGKRYCFLPRQSVIKELENGTLIEIPVLDIELPKKQSYMIYSKAKKSQPFVSKYIQLLKEI